jgi:hypothetical protein
MGESPLPDKRSGRHAVKPIPPDPKSSMARGLDMTRSIQKRVCTRVIAELKNRATAGRPYETVDPIWSSVKMVPTRSTGTLYRIVLGLMLIGQAFTSAASALADGGAWRYDGSSMKLLAMNEQRAFITFKDGIQRMALAVNLSDAGLPENAWFGEFPKVIRLRQFSLRHIGPLLGNGRIVFLGGGNGNKAYH